MKFCIEEEFEKALFIELYNPKSNTLDINFTFNNNLKQRRVNYEIKGGNKKDNSISNESLGFIRNIYLSALRDANRYLTAERCDILSSFFSKLFSDDYKEDMMDEINNKLIKVRFQNLSPNQIMNAFKIILTGKNLKMKK